MSFLDNIGDLETVEELRTVQVGEYELKITSAELRSGDNGEYLVVRFDVTSDPLAKGITHTVFPPRESDDAKQRHLRKLEMKHFCQAFDLSTSGGLSCTEMVGKRGWAILAEKDDPEYGMQNRVRRFIVPK